MTMKRKLYGVNIFRVSSNETGVVINAPEGVDLKDHAQAIGHYFNDCFYPFDEDLRECQLDVTEIDSDKESVALEDILVS
jgi:hypothetical protein